MATRTAVASGLWSAAGTWDTGVPVNGDTAVIPLAYDVEFDADQSGFASGVTVTLNGTLHASTTAGAYVLKLAANMTGSGTLRAGTSGTPYPTNCTFTISRGTNEITATSMTLDLNCSEPTVKWCKLSGVEAAGQTVLSVDTDLTGYPAYWYDGALVRICDVNNGNDNEERTIAVGGIAASTITVTAGLSAQKETGTYVALVSRNVKIVGSAATGFAINGAVGSTIKAEIRTASVGIVATSSVIGGTITGSTTAMTTVYSNTISAVVAGGTNGITSSSGNILTSASLITGFSNAGINTSFGIICQGIIAGIVNGIRDSGGLTIYGTISGCTIGVRVGAGITFVNATLQNATDLFQVVNSVAYNTVFAGATENSGYNGTAVSVVNFVKSIDHDQVAGAYKAWTKGGIATKQATTYPSGYTYAFDYALESATAYCFWQQEVTVPAGGGLVVECLIRKDASMSYLPRLWLLLPGVEPLISGSPSYEAIMTNSVDTWETLLLVYANATTADVQITVRTIGQNATGHVYALPIVTVLAPATYDVYSTLQADLDDIQSRIPATLVGGRMDSYVGSMATDSLTAAALSAGAVAEIQSGLATAASIAALPSATSIVEAILTAGVADYEDNADAASLTELILAALESSRSATTWTIRKTDGSTFNTRTLTLDADADPVTGVT